MAVKGSDSMEKREGAAAFALFACSSLIALFVLPFAFYPLGIAGDYPNHLARVFIQGAIGEQPVLNQYYSVDWKAIPDLAMDLVLAPFIGTLDTLQAGMIFSVFALALLPVGGLLLHYAVYRRWSLWPLGALPAIYGAPLALGLMNFIAGLGLSLIAFAGWLAFRESSLLTRGLLFGTAALLLWFSHALGFLTFGYLVLAYETQRCFTIERDRTFLTAREACLQFLVFVVPLGFLVLSFLSLSGLPSEAVGFRSFFEMLSDFSFAFALSDPGQRIVVLAVYVLTLAGLWWAGAVRWHPALLGPLLAVGFLVLLIPGKFFGIHLLQVRLPALFFVLLFAGSEFTATQPLRRALFALLLAGILAWQWTWVRAHVAEIDTAQAGMVEAFGAMEPGARLLSAWEAPEGRAELIDRYLYHSSSLAVIAALAYEPKLFTNTSVVGVKDELRALHEPQGYPVLLQDLVAGAAEPPPVAGGQGAYYDGWPQSFDYLLWLGQDDLSIAETYNLSLVAKGKLFRLYRMGPVSSSSSAPASHR